MFLCCLPAGCRLRLKGRTSFLNKKCNKNAFGCDPLKKRREKVSHSRVGQKTRSKTLDIILPLTYSVKYDIWTKKVILKPKNVLKYYKILYLQMYLSRLMSYANLSF